MSIIKTTDRTYEFVSTGTHTLLIANYITNATVVNVTFTDTYTTILPNNDDFYYVSIDGNIVADIFSNDNVIGCMEKLMNKIFCGKEHCNIPVKDMQKYIDEMEKLLQLIWKIYVNIKRGHAPGTFPSFDLYTTASQDEMSDTLDKIHKITKRCGCRHKKKEKYNMNDEDFDFEDTDL